MLLPRKYEYLLFSALISMCMISIVSACVILLNQGYTPDFFQRWGRTFVTTWPIAFPVVTFITPFVKRLAGMLTHDKA